MGSEDKKIEALETPDLSLQIGRPIRAIAAIFDLKDYTAYCGQRDFSAVVVEFLNKFVEWFLNQLVELSTDPDDNSKSLCPPFLKVKFMGDGLMVLWDAENRDKFELDFVVYLSYMLCERYELEFHPQVKGSELDSPPELLRCGIAQGHVTPVENELVKIDDYVGDCINLASRLEKLPGCTFAFNTKLFPCDKQQFPFFNSFCQVTTEIKGISSTDLPKIAIHSKELESMSWQDKRKYKKVK